jgi:hypothetical protein
VEVPEILTMPEDEAIAETLTSESERQIQLALVVGNYAAAVEACMADGRMADALLLASIGGEDLWHKVQKAFMKREPKPYMKVVKALMDKDLASLVRDRSLARWRETLAMLCTYVPIWTRLLNHLISNCTWRETVFEKRLKCGFLTSEMC